jgi:hypothetical protein
MFLPKVYVGPFQVLVLQHCDLLTEVYVFFLESTDFRSVRVGDKMAVRSLKSQHKMGCNKKNNTKMDLYIS